MLRGCRDGRRAIRPGGDPFLSRSYLRLPCGTVGQELFKDGGEDLRDEVVALVFEDAGARRGHHVSQCRRLFSYERGALAADDDEGGDFDGSRQLCGQGPVAQDLGLVNEGVRHSLQGWSERGQANLGDDFGRDAHGLRLEELDRLSSTTLFHQPGEPCCEIPRSRPVPPSALTGGSYNANLGMVSP